MGPPPIQESEIDLEPQAIKAQPEGHLYSPESGTHMSLKQPQSSTAKSVTMIVTYYQLREDISLFQLTWQILSFLYRFSIFIV